MAARKVTPVGADDVRAWGKVNGFATGKRGRLSASLVEAFEKANKGHKYVVGHKDEAPVEVQVETRDKNNRKRVKVVKVTTPEARAYAEANGLSVGKRGRVSQETLVAVATAKIS